MLSFDQTHLARCLHEHCLASKHGHSANFVQTWTALCLACFGMSGRQSGPTGQLRSAPGSVGKRADIRIIGLLLSHGADPHGATPNVSNHDINSNMLPYQIWYWCRCVGHGLKCLQPKTSAKFEWASQLCTDMGHAHVWLNAEHGLCMQYCNAS